MLVNSYFFRYSRKKREREIVLPPPPSPIEIFIREFLLRVLLHHKGEVSIIRIIERLSTMNFVFFLFQMKSISFSFLQRGLAYRAVPFSATEQGYTYSITEKHLIDHQQKLAPSELCRKSTDDHCVIVLFCKQSIILIIIENKLQVLYLTLPPLAPCPNNPKTPAPRKMRIRVYSFRKLVSSREYLYLYC